jgi:23S rRNA pseudouridine2605 synthase
MGVGDRLMGRIRGALPGNRPGLINRAQQAMPRNRGKGGGRRDAMGEALGRLGAGSAAGAMQKGGPGQNPMAAAGGPPPQAGAMPGSRQQAFGGPPQGAPPMAMGQMAPPGAPPAMAMGQGQKMAPGGPAPGGPMAKPMPQQQMAAAPMAPQGGGRRAMGGGGGFGGGRRRGRLLG